MLRPQHTKQKKKKKNTTQQFLSILPSNSYNLQWSIILNKLEFHCIVH